MPKQLAPRQMMISALTSLKEGNFSAYLSVLAQLGIDITAYLAASPPKTSSYPLATVSLSLLDEFSAEELRDMRLRHALFTRYWRKPADDSDKKAAFCHDAKYDLNYSTRRQIHLGMLLVDNTLQTLQALAREKKSDVAHVDAASFIGVQNAVYLAIRSYRTRKQKIIQRIGKTLAALTSMSYGLLQNSVATFFIGCMFFHPVGFLALSITLGTSLVLGGIFSYVCYCTQRDDVPSLMNEAFGRDKFLQGFLEHKANGKKPLPLNRKQKTALGLFTACCVVPTAIASGALSFTSILSLQTLFAAFGVAASAAIFPPIGIVIGSLIAITTTFFLLRSFHRFITEHHGNPIKFVKKPFDDLIEAVDKRFDREKQPGLNKFTKGLCLTLAGLTCVMGVAGLTISSLGGVNSVTALMQKMFKLPLMTSAIIGIALGGVISFTSKICQTIAKSGSTFVKFMKKYFEPQASRTNILGVLAGVIVDLPLSAFFWIRSFLAPPAASPILPMPTDVKSAVLVTSCTTVKDAGLVFDSMIEEKKPRYTPDEEKCFIKQTIDKLDEGKTFNIPSKAYNNCRLFAASANDADAPRRNDEVQEAVKEDCVTNAPDLVDQRSLIACSV